MYLKKLFRPVVPVPWYKRQKNLSTAAPLAKDLLKYQVSGKGVDRDTWIYIRPDQVAVKVAKFADLGQRLFGPFQEA